MGKVTYSTSFLLCAVLLATSGMAHAQSPDRTVPHDLPAASVSVDSTFYGYMPSVLNDGKWIDVGREQEPLSSETDRLGNGGNTWVSSDTAADHWIQLEWPRAVDIDEVRICWSLAEWYPRAFRIERRDGDKWVPAAPDSGWFEVTDRQTIIPLSRIRTQALRVFQPAIGACLRRFLAAQEVSAHDGRTSSAALTGAIRITEAQFQRLAPPALERNIARLASEFPGACSARRWSGAGVPAEAPGLADGDATRTATTLKAKHAVGVEWPVEHAIHGAVMCFDSAPPRISDFVVEIRDSQGWVPIPVALTAKTDDAGRRIEWAFEPLAVRGLRLRLRSGNAAVTELEVYRYLPNGHRVWPEHLTGGGFQQRILALPEEPSYERVALGGLSMRTARTLVGLKDTLRESAVGCDGTIHGKAALRFSFGPENRRMDEFPDTTVRSLIDGWRPGVEIQSRMDDLEVRETVFAVPAGTDGAKPALFIRMSLRNLSDHALTTSLMARVVADRANALQARGNVLVRDNKVELISLSHEGTTETPGALVFHFALPSGGQAHADFVHPQEAEAAGSDLAFYRALAFGPALEAFRNYWDKELSSPTLIETPEPRVNRMIKAVLAQIFINGDGNLMPYGAGPSVYEGSVFGIEESYPILALAMFGFERDAMRYMDTTLLAPHMLAKKDRYETVHDRHQQYRNGLEPHYAISAYRLSRNARWIEKHLPLVRQCADWTMTQRRSTMTLENGERPLTWGLLPKCAYGGDVAELQCHPFYGNYCCWRGLVDTAWLLDQLGDHESAKRYASDAVDYRAAIDRAMEGSYLKDRQPPYVPLRVSGDKPDELIDFYQLFGGCLLDVEPFARGDRHLEWITSFMEQDNRLFCLLPRYREAGPGGLDALYGKGIFLEKLHAGDVRQFLLSFYAYLAFNLERDTFAGRESNVIYASDLHARSVYGNPELSDPLPCASAVALHLVRHMLVTEERGEPGRYSGDLLLLAGAPSAWLGDGKRIRLRQVPTHFGPIDVDIRSAVSRGVVEADITPPRRNPCQTIKLRLPHPDGHHITSVRVNGRAWKDYDAQNGVVRLPGAERALRVRAAWGRSGHPTHFTDPVTTAAVTGDNTLPMASEETP